jgi:hypothetical protein
MTAGLTSEVINLQFPIPNSQGELSAPSGVELSGRKVWQSRSPWELGVGGWETDFYPGRIFSPGQAYG